MRVYLDGVNDGTRTRDIRHHKPALYQLSYAHHVHLTQISPGEKATRRLYYNLEAKFSTTAADTIWSSSVVGPGSETNTERR